MRSKADPEGRLLAWRWDWTRRGRRAGLLAGPAEGMYRDRSRGHLLGSEGGTRALIRERTKDRSTVRIDADTGGREE
jgi:hypothetical protein